jgi:integrating conjugative element protein (TIGR03757 family)
MPLSPKGCFSRPMIAALLLLATSLGAYADERGREVALLIEVFTTSQYPIQKRTSLRAPNDSRERYRRYDIDRISLLEQQLSQGLPNDPVRAKQLVLTRFQTMDATLSDQLENAGKGLAQAMTYGIDRLPAVVFEGQAIVYGVTDIDEALAQYHQWRERTER